MGSASGLFRTRRQAHRHSPAGSKCKQPPEPWRASPTEARRSVASWRLTIRPEGLEARSRGQLVQALLHREG